MDTHFQDSIGQLLQCGDNFCVRLTSRLRLLPASWFRFKANRQKLAICKFVNSEVQNQPSQELKNNPTLFIMWTNTDSKLLFNHTMIWLGRGPKDHLIPGVPVGRDTFHSTRLLQASSKDKFNSEIDFHFSFSDAKPLDVNSYQLFKLWRDSSCGHQVGGCYQSLISVSCRMVYYGLNITVCIRKYLFGGILYCFFIGVFCQCAGVVLCGTLIWHPTY